MHTKAALLTLGASAALAQNANSTCHDYVLVNIRGTFEAQGPSIGFRTMSSYILGNVTNGVEYDVVYPAAQNQTYYFGSNDAVRFINAGLQSCPNQRYAVLGYSQGASATGGALQNFTDPSSAGYKAISAVVVIGNPYKIPNRDNDVDQDGGTSMRQYRGAILNESNPLGVYGNGIPDVFYSSGKLLDICYNGDPICAPAAPGANLTNHLLYSGNPTTQEMGARHIIDRLTATNGTGITNGTDTTGSGSGNSTSGDGSGTGSGTGSGSGNATGSGSGSGSGTTTGAAAGMVVPTAVFAAMVGLVMAVVI